MSNYQAFIQSKTRRAKPLGFDPVYHLPDLLFPFQRAIVEWAVRRGRAAIFAGCGLGKTGMQLAWADQVYRKTGRMVLLFCPVGVRRQTMHEADKFGIEHVHVVDSQDECNAGINITNYEKLHKFDCSLFGGVVLDESSILKSIDGKTKKALIELFYETPYRLACTATPAPNDYDELGNHSEFLGIMQQTVMRSMFFTHDGGDTSKWRLRRHGERDFWDWVSSWAVCCEKPSDIGSYADDGYILPGCQRIEHIVDHEEKPTGGMLFFDSLVSATGVHKVKRSTVEDRAAKCCEIIAREPDEPWVVWCDTNYEADELRRQFSADSRFTFAWQEIRGDMPIHKKEQTLDDFAEGKIQVLLTKPEIAGHGMNWQHVARQCFAGMSFSFERYYQAVRRSLRFGQTREVHIHIIGTELESGISQVVFGKEEEFERMQRSMVAKLHDFQVASINGDRMQRPYTPEKGMVLPKWMY